MPTDPTKAQSVLDELNFPGNISNGAGGMLARRVQEWLSIFGNGCATTVDESFGSATETAVKKYQTIVGIPSTGVVDSATWLQLTSPLRAALTPPPVGPAHTVSSLTLSVAQTHLAQKPVEVGGENCGPWVRIYMEGNQGEEWPWCAGFVSFLFKHAAFLLGQDPPIPGSFGCDELADQAEQANLFVEGSTLDGTNWNLLTPTFLFLWQDGNGGYFHTGLGFNAQGQNFSTIEGNTNDDGSANGYEVLERIRALGSKDFIKL